MKCNYEFQAIPESGIIAYPEGDIIRIFFDITPAQPVSSESESGEDADENQTYDCNQVDVYGRSYGDIVSAIVSDKYSNDEVQAIIANYTEAMDEESDLPDEKREEYLTEYSEFQQWRKHAKAVATVVLEQLD